VLPDFIRRLFTSASVVGISSPWPEPLRDYMARKRKPAKSAPFHEVRFVVFDTETTGLDLAKNRLLSIAGVAMSGAEVALDDTFDVMVAQADVGGADAAVVHGLISNDLVGGLPEGEAVARFLAFAADSVLVAHHAWFDLRMLQKAIAPYRGAKVWSPVVDTAQLARRVEVGPMPTGDAHGAEDRESYRLDNLVRRYAIEVPERHTAAGDALATALLFQRLLRKAERRGITTLGDLLSR
jgi:DNA polymerase-3 subunit epsilon